MATNADDVIEDDKQVTEDDLRALKYPEDGVDGETQDDTDGTADETTDESDETSDETAQSDDEATDESQDSEAFTKKFDNIQGETPEEYARNLEIAYQNSTAEALRLKGLAETQQARGATEAVTNVADVIEEDATAEVDVNDPVALYMKQKMDEEITSAYTSFSKDYPQVADAPNYTKFTKTVAQLSRTIVDSEKRLAPPSELYSKAAVILGWEKDTVTEADKLSAAVKNNAASGKTSSATKPIPKSKVSDAMIAANRRMYPNKTDTEIRTELEEYV